MMTMNCPGSLSWADLVAIEPKLDALYREVQAVDPYDPDYSFGQAWYGQGGFKDALVRLVGWEAAGQPRILKTMEAYDLAYDKLVKAAPCTTSSRRAASWAWSSTMSMRRCTLASTWPRRRSRR
jgi:hypothetical protein